MNVSAHLRSAVSNRKDDLSAGNPCASSRDLTPQISDQSRSDTRHITFEIGYHLSRGTETSASGRMQQPAVPDLATIVSGNVTILAGADNDNLLRSC